MFKGTQKLILIILILISFHKFAVAEGESGLSLEQRIDRLERLTSSQKQLELLYRVQQLQNENRELRGLIEEQTHTIKQLTAQQRDLYQDVDRRLSLIEKAGAPVKVDDKNDSNKQTGMLDQNYQLDEHKPAGNENAGNNAANVEVIDKSVPFEKVPRKEETVEVIDKSVPAAKKVAGKGDSLQQPIENNLQADKAPMSANDPARLEAEQKAYQAAFDELKASRYEIARDSFTSFIAEYPDGRYAHIAQYWAGEASYALKDYPRAIEDYGKLLANYENSPKRAEAQLKIGYSWYELGDIDKAREALTRTEQDYSGTTEAAQARRLIKRL